MMSHDVNVSESIYQENAQEAFEKLLDPKMERNAQNDLHTAIDLMYEFAKQIKGLHPLAEKQIKIMLLQGNVL